MAKETKSSVMDDLNDGGTGLDDLNAGGAVADSIDTGDQQHDGDVADSSGGDESGNEEAAPPEYVVLKGNCIRHDGVVYRENTRILVSGDDAARLLAAGVIADIQVLRQRLLSAAPAVSVTSE
ncbi:MULTISPECIES: hypothetical protein [Klebsiella pneumoniae complex]|nr:hypothetical protein [Klebsiella quasipneumoniae]MDU5050916.1 hypothetical protein [Klebsiella variicola]MEB5581419.1 hypothetical protein [Klebsiella quasipneumoniae]MEB5747917.1 hypothetical protein [Klebsiella quasipneumoniae]